MCPTLCSMPGFPVPHRLLKFAQVHAHCISDAIQPSHPLLPSSPSILNLSQHQGLFQWVSCLHQMTKILELQLQHQSLQQYSRLIFPLRLTGLIDLLADQGILGSLLLHLRSKIFILQCYAFFTVQFLQLYVITERTIALTVWAFVGRVISLLFSTLSRFIIAFLPRSNHLISWLQSPSAVILESKKRKSVTTSTFLPSICHEVMGPDAIILVFF